jgi:2,3-bisphosphoglycerate-dependent phosphoglycerate mutase
LEEVLLENYFQRSYDIPPPGFDAADPSNPINDRRYHGIPRDALPLTECLKDTVARVIPFWHDHIARDILAGKRVIVVAHGNSIRAIVKYLDNVPEKGCILF